MKPETAAWLNNTYRDTTARAKVAANLLSRTARGSLSWRSASHIVYQADDNGHVWSLQRGKNLTLFLDSRVVPALGLYALWALVDRMFSEESARTEILDFANQVASGMTEREAHIAKRERLLEPLPVPPGVADVEDDQIRNPYQ